jgi:hypothetical protein
VDIGHQRTAFSALNAPAGFTGKVNNSANIGITSANDEALERSAS